MDDHIVAIEKPAHLPTLSLKNKSGDSLAKRFLERYPEQSFIGLAGEAGILHRLDNDTSGIVLAAKNEESYNIMKRMFKDEEVKKIYLALVLGQAPSSFVINKSISHHPRKRAKMVICENGRKATTEFEAIKHFDGFTLLKATILKGARHQIRAHLASIGHPIAGDRLYQNPKKKSVDIADLNRQFLHAYGISFRHPKMNKEICLISALPKELMHYITSPTRS